MSATKYRITDDANTENHPRLMAEFRKYGIVRYCNALPPRARKRHVQVFVYEDGWVELEDSNITAKVVRALAGKN